MCPRRCGSSPRRAPVVALVAAAALLALAGGARAQEQPNPDELKRLHDEAIVQLKAAQDRKNELAAENEALKARIAELEGLLNERAIEAAGWAERTWYLRSHYAAWQRFLERYPQLRERWRMFLRASEIDPLNDLPRWDEPSVSHAD